MGEGPTTLVLLVGLPYSEVSNVNGFGRGEEKYAAYNAFYGHGASRCSYPKGDYRLERSLNATITFASNQPRKVFGLEKKRAKIICVPTVIKRVPTVIRGYKFMLQYLHDH